MSERRNQLESPQLGPVSVVSFRGDLLVIRASTPAPPGTRITLCERGCTDELVMGKVTSVDADRPEPGRWDLQVRLFGPSKTAKSRLNDLASK